MLSIVEWTPIIFGWLGIMLLLSGVRSTARLENGYLGLQRRASPWYAWLVFLPIFIFVVYGVVLGDTYAYLISFRYFVPSSFRDAGMYISDAKEKGFAIFNVLVKSIFGYNPTAYRFIIALVHTIPVVVILRRYSEDYLFSVYVFIASAYHLAWMTNGLRQFMAVAMIFAATPWIVEKKFVRTWLLILLAATFHRSALFMIPVVYIATREAWRWQTILMIIGVSLATLLFARNRDSFDSIAELAGYSMQAVYEEGDDGMNVIRALVAAVPAVMAFLARKELAEEGDPVINLCVNMSIITVGVSMIAVVTSGILTGRMPIYTSLYNLILFPRVIRAHFRGHARTIVIAVAVVLYFIYFQFE